MKLVVIILSCATSAISSCQEVRDVKVTVTDDEGVPVQGVISTVSFMGVTAASTQRTKGETNAQGVFQASGKPQLTIHVRLEKEGYYSTESDRLPRNQDHDVCYVIRKIRNPIPLYAKRLQVVAPIVGEQFAYDCEIGDWVAPHGEGKIEDLIFKVVVHRMVDEYADYRYDVTASFKNKNDGFVKFDQFKPSELSAPYEAPENKTYADSWTYFKERDPQRGIVTNAEPNRGYIFRLRTQVDNSGRVISCHYAKAIGDIPELEIYFNPKPNDRNLEFDPSQNLFGELSPIEQVLKP
jgi:hypothetical protein